jgi:SAM-dependent methyltransferase
MQSQNNMLSPINTVNGVLLFDTPNLQLSNAYLLAREKEGRVLTDEQVALLPNFFGNAQVSKEWRCRNNTLNRFENYLHGKRYNNVLEIGCGNGWFSNRLANYANNVVAQDINIPELEQAVRVFNEKNIDFSYVESIEDWVALFSFDLIVFNASIQYFENVQPLFDALKNSLTHNGEIHILDSCIYDSVNEVFLAKNRTDEYYKKIDVPEMSRNYFHKSNNDFLMFERLYTHKNNLMNKFFKPYKSPFPWLRYIHKIS